ncbi:MAG: hypothetical protein ACUVWZ_14685 [Anaerolineae bacterium]
MADGANEVPGFPGSGVSHWEWDGGECLEGIGWRCKNRGQRRKTILALRSAGMGEGREWKQAWEQIRQAA